MNWWEESPRKFADGFTEEVTTHHTPRVGEQRINKAADSEQQYYRWQFEIDGVWEFKAALTAQEVKGFAAAHRFLYADDAYDYYAA